MTPAAAHEPDLTPYETWMRRALLESAWALPDCRPNPPVGCVIVSNGAVVASGHTQAPGQPHAEAMALSQLSNQKLAEAEVYVTLEPCSFHGRTPSCARTLIDAGAATVFVAIVDPHPRNRGRGIEMLREAGATVHVGLLERDVRRFLDPFLIYG